MPGIAGDPAAVEAAADGLERTATRLVEVRDAVATRRRAVGEAWQGSASLAAVTAVEGVATGTTTLADVAARVVVALRAFADEIHRAQLDWAEGERMLLQGQAALAGAGSGAPADAAREQGRLVMTDGVAVMDTAAERARLAHETAARALAEASAELARLSPSTPVVPEDGDVVDGLRKAGGDVVDEITGTVGGAIDHVNVFGDRFGETWSTTFDTVATAVADPLAAGSAIVQGTVEPIVDSYRSGGLDEAIGRSPGVIAAALGGKGIPKLARLADVPEHGPDPRPSTPLAPGGGLQRHQDAGGHTLTPKRAHVGATDQELLDRQARAQEPIEASTYFAREVAEGAIHDNIVANQAAIDRWLRTGPTEPDRFEFPHPWAIGRFSPLHATGTGDIVDAMTSRVVLMPDSTRPEGYYILTSYPRP